MSCRKTNFGNVLTACFCRIIAIMLGRLSMSVKQCITAYKGFSEQAFVLRPGFHLASPNGRYSANALEEVIKDVISKRCVSMGCNGESCKHDLVFRENTCCKT